MNVWMKSLLKGLIFTLFIVGILAVVDYLFIPENISEWFLKSLSVLIVIFAIYLIIKHERNKGDGEGNKK